MSSARTLKIESTTKGVFMNSFKDMVNTGIGAAFLLKEKIESELDELVQSGKLKKEDAKEAIERALQKGKEQEEQMREKVKSIIKEVIDELGLATKEDVEKLKDGQKKD